MDHFTLDDNPFEDANLKGFSDLGKERDDLLDSCEGAPSDVNQTDFEKMLNEKESNWFGENEPDYDKAKNGNEAKAANESSTSSVFLEPRTEEQKTEVDIKDEPPERMDISPPESSPWPEDGQKGNTRGCIIAGTSGRN